MKSFLHIALRACTPFFSLLALNHALAASLPEFDSCVRDLRRAASAKGMQAPTFDTAQAGIGTQPSVTYLKKVVRTEPAGGHKAAGGHA